MRQIWVIADTHFNHESIIDFERKQFTSVEEHNQTIIDNYNKVVGDEDIVYFLGDIGFTGYKYNLKDLAKLISKMKGHKILIMGNHDKFLVGEAKGVLGFEEVHVGPYYYSDHIILSHEPVREALDNPYVVNVHGHLHNANLNLPNFFNVNVAQRNYFPTNMALFKREEHKCKTRRETFKQEWYAPYYNFFNKEEK